MRVKLFICFILILFFEIKVQSTENTDLIKKYKFFIDKLPDTDICMILYAKSEYSSLLQNNKNLSESVFRIFLEKYYKIIKSVRVYDEHKLKDNGVLLKESEGHRYLEYDYVFLYEMIRDRNFEIKKYIEFMILESQEKIGEDGGLFISWENLRERILRWETFAQTNPELEETKSVIIPEIKKLFKWYICGLDNTRIYKFKTKKLSIQLKKSYETFLKKNLKSGNYDLMKKLNNLYSSSNLVITDEIKKYLSEKGYRIIF